MAANAANITATQKKYSDVPRKIIILAVICCIKPAAVEHRLCA